VGVVVLFLALSSNVQRNSHNPVALLLWVYKHEGTHDDNADDDDMSISNPVANFFSMQIFWGKILCCSFNEFLKKRFAKNQKKDLKSSFSFLNF
jgi:hypothetical protein